MLQKSWSEQYCEIQAHNKSTVWQLLNSYLNLFKIWIHSYVHNFTGKTNVKKFISGNNSDIYISNNSLPGLRVVTSHFSGVVIIILVAIISGFVRCISPVNSRTDSPRGSSRLPKLRAISAASAFIGAIYTTYTYTNYSYDVQELGIQSLFHSKM